MKSIFEGNDIKFVHDPDTNSYQELNVKELSLKVNTADLCFHCKVSHCNSKCEYHIFIINELRKQS